jgi:PAS domain S-box-containing protein
VIFQLEKVKELILNVAASISAVMDVDIAILDVNKKIIGGSIGDDKTCCVSRAADHIMKKKEFVIIEEPGVDEICRGCQFFGDCKEMIELNAPIIYDKECVGIISVTAYNEEKRENILKKKDAYKKLLISMTDLISSQIGAVLIHEQLQLTMSRLSSIMNSVNGGMLAFDMDDRVIYSNSVAEKITGYEKDQLRGKKLIDFFYNTAHIKSPAKKEQGSRCEAKIVCGDGNEIDAYISIDIMHNEFGYPIGTVIIIEEPGSIQNLEGNIMGYNIRNCKFSDIIGKSGIMQRTKEKALKASQSDSTLLILGESGTGKELFARAVHNASKRSESAFVAINCAAIPESLLESELFGYEAGAFTGADRHGKTGKFELADKGTIFLDEIGDMPICLQAKILRVLQEQCIQRIGGVKEKDIDIRIIAATNKDLARMVAENRFREDLYYRLNVIPLHIPPLRERKEDIRYLIDFLLAKYRKKLGKKIYSVSDSVKDVFLTYPWPGNIREIENVIEYAMNMESGTILDMQSIPENIKEKSIMGTNYDESLKNMLKNHECSILKEKLQNQGNTLEAKKKIAAELGIGIATLYRKLREFDLDCH